MNTPAHLLLGLTAFSRKGRPRVTAAAAFGALLPDLSLYVMASVSLYLLRIPPAQVFGELYFSDAWQTVFAIDNSIPLWGALLALAIWKKSEWGIALCGAALIHIAMDLPLHHDDGRPHFWPLSDWVYQSPVSYWDSRHHAGWIAPMTGLVAVICAGVLLRRHSSWLFRGAILALLAIEMWTIRSWLMFF